MPITKSAKKALRQSDRKRAINDRRRKAMKEAIKTVEKLVKTGKQPEAVKSLSTAFQAIDKAGKSGVIKKGNASRKKSRLAKLAK